MQEIKVFEEFEHMLYKYRCYLENQFNKMNRVAFHPCEPLVYLYDMEKVEKDSEGDDELNRYDPDFVPIPESDFVHHSDIILYSNDLEIWYSDILESQAEIIRDVLNNVKPYYFADITANYYIQLNSSNVFQLMDILDRRVYGFVKNENLDQCWQEVDIIGNLLFLQANMPEETKVKRGKSSVSYSKIEQPRAPQPQVPEYEIVNISVKGEEFYCLGEYEPLIDNYDASYYDDNIEFDFNKINLLLPNTNQISVFGKLINLDLETIKEIGPFAKIIRKHALKAGNDYIKTVEELKADDNFQDSLSTLTIPYNLMIHSCIAAFVEESYKLLPPEVGSFFKTFSLSNFIDEYISGEYTIFPKFIKAQCGKIDQIYSNINLAKRNIEAFSEGNPMFVGGGFGIKGAIKGMLTAEALNIGAEGLNTLYQVASANSKNKKIAQDIEKLYKSEAYNNILFYLMYHDVYSFLFHYAEVINEVANTLRAIKTNDVKLPNISKSFNTSASYFIHILSKINKVDAFANSNFNDKPLLELIKNAILEYPYEYEYYKMMCDLSGEIDYSIVRFAKLHGVDISNIYRDYIAKKTQKAAQEKQQVLQKQEETKINATANAATNVTQTQSNLEKSEIDINEQLQMTEYKCLSGYIYLPNSGQKYLTKFNNAVTSYAKLQQNENVLLLFDNTVFGSAKDGFILTNKNIYFKNMFQNPSSISLKDIETIQEDGKYDFLVNNNIKIEISVMNSSEKCRVLVKLVKLIISSL